MCQWTVKPQSQCAAGQMGGASFACADDMTGRAPYSAHEVRVDTLFVVSIFAILALILGSVALLALGLILAVIPLIIGARLGRMDAPERQPLLT